MSSYRRDLGRQQQEITTLKESHKPPYSEKWNISPALHPAGAAWPERAVLSRNALRLSANQSDWAVVPSGTKEDTECEADIEQETPVETVEKG